MYTQIHTPTLVQRGGGGWGVGFDVTPLHSFWNVAKWFCLQWKAFDLLYKMRYILWVVTRKLKNGRDSFRKAREAHLIHKAKTIERLGISKRDEL